MLLDPLRDQVGEGLGLDHGAGGVGDVKGHELEPPLGDAAGGLLVFDDVPQATGRHDHHRVGVEVVPELAHGDERSIEELLDPRVLGLQVGEDLADKVYQ